MKGACWWQELGVQLSSTRPQAKSWRGASVYALCGTSLKRAFRLFCTTGITCLSLSEGSHHMLSYTGGSQRCRFLQTVVCEPLLSLAYWFSGSVKPCWNILPLHSPLLRLGEYSWLKFKIISSRFPGCGLFSMPLYLQINLHMGNI